MTTAQDLIDETLDYFNFAKVASVMQFLQWKWAYCDCPGGIPDESALRAEARKQMTRVVKEATSGEWEEDNHSYVAGTGGFQVTVRKWQGNVCSVHLQFYVSEWIAEDYSE